MSLHAEDMEATRKLADAAAEKSRDRGIDPHSIRPRRDWALILQDPRKDTLSCGLIIPMETNHEKLHEGSGLLVHLGPGEKAKAMGLEENSRVMYRTYLRHAHRIEPDAMHAKYTDGTPMEWFFIAVEDIIAVLEPGVEVGLLSEKK